VNKEETMKILRFPIAACLALCLAAPLPAAETTANPAWEKLKTLVGDWVGTENGDVHVSYRLVSSGTALMETLEGSHAMQMITMYTPDGDAVLMTHYCSMGNQPRMRATRLADNKVTFGYVDAANVKGPDDPRMSGLTLTFIDADHLRADWTYRTGTKEEVSHFAYARKK
jgi:hypothetical protein